MCTGDLARVCAVKCPSLFRNLIASLLQLGDALDARSSCPIGSASTQLRSFALQKPLRSNIPFYIVVRSTILCAVDHPSASLAVSSLMPNLSEFDSSSDCCLVTVVYPKASVLYCRTCSLSGQKSLLVCLLPTPNLSNHRAWSRLHPLLCMISPRPLLSGCLFSFITRGSRMRLFFPFSHLASVFFWFVSIYTSACLSLVAWFKDSSMILDSQTSSQPFAALWNWSLGPIRHLYDPHDTFTTFTTHGCYLVMLNMRRWKPTP